jgi:hypothetical protein
MKTSEQVERGVCSYCEELLFAKNKAEREALAHPLLGSRWSQVWLCLRCRKTVQQLRSRGARSSPGKRERNGRPLPATEVRCAVCADSGRRQLCCQRCGATFCNRCFGCTLGDWRTPPCALGSEGLRIVQRLNAILWKKGVEPLDERVSLLPAPAWMCPLCCREQGLRLAFESWLKDLPEAPQRGRLAEWTTFRERYDYRSWNPWWLWCGSLKLPQVWTQCSAGSKLTQLLDAAFSGDWKRVQTVHEDYGKLLTALEELHMASGGAFPSRQQRFRHMRRGMAEPLRLNARAQELLERYPTGPTESDALQLDCTEHDSGLVHDWYRVYSILCIAIRELLVAVAWSRLVCASVVPGLWLPVQRHVLEALPFRWDDLWSRHGTICFRCGRPGGSGELLHRCDIPGCGKVYHASCVSCLSRAPYFTNGSDLTERRHWYCPWHFDRSTGWYLPSEPYPSDFISLLEAHASALPSDTLERIPWLGVVPRSDGWRLPADESAASEHAAVDRSTDGHSSGTLTTTQVPPFRAVQCRTCPFSCSIPNQAGWPEDHSEWYVWDAGIISCCSCSVWLEPPQGQDPTELACVAATWKDAGASTRVQRATQRHDKRQRLATAPSPASRHSVAPSAPSAATFAKMIRQAAHEGAARIQEAKARGDVPLVQGRSGEYIDALEYVRAEYEKYEKGNTGAVVGIMAALKSANGKPVTFSELTLELLRRGWFVTTGKTPQMTIAAFFSTRRQRLMEQGQTCTWFEWLGSARVRWCLDTPAAAVDDESSAAPADSANT